MQFKPTPTATQGGTSEAGVKEAVHAVARLLATIEVTVGDSFLFFSFPFLSCPFLYFFLYFDFIFFFILFSFSDNCPYLLRNMPIGCNAAS
jgi:hypothetical protein